MGSGAGVETIEAPNLVGRPAGAHQCTGHLDSQARPPSGCGNQEARVRAPLEGAASLEGSPSLGPEPTSYFTTRLGRRLGGLSLLRAPSPPPFCRGRLGQPRLGGSCWQDGRGGPRVRQTRLCAFGPSDHGGLHGEPKTQVDKGLRLPFPSPQAPRSPSAQGGSLYTHPPTAPLCG